MQNYKQSLHINNLTKKIDQKLILDNISVSIYDAKITAIMGANGAGKSTLLKEMAGLNGQQKSRKVSQYSENIYYSVNNKKISAGLIHQHKDILKIAYIPQFDHCYWDLSVVDVLEISAKTLIKDKIRRQKAVDEIILDLNIQNLQHQSYLTLSGGQKARVILARAMINHPNFLFADEPIASLDVKYQHEALKYLKNIFLKNTRMGFSAIVILHDINLAYQYADEVIMLKEGRILKHGNVQSVMNEAVLSEAFDVPIIKSEMNIGNQSKTVFFDKIIY